MKVNSVIGICFFELMPDAFSINLIEKASCIRNEKLNLIVQIFLHKNLQMLEKFPHAYSLQKARVQQ